MLKFHFTFDKDKMAQWLNQMDRSGWELKWVGAGFCRFVRGTPGLYDYQIDYAGFGGLDPAYAALMEELGIERVCRWGPWVVFRRRSADGPFVLYTDADSRARHLMGVRRFFLLMTLLELLATAFMMGLALVTQHVWMLLISLVGLTASVGMIRMLGQLRRELASLGTSSER